MFKIKEREITAIVNIGGVGMKKTESWKEKQEFGSYGFHGFFKDRRFEAQYNELRTSFVFFIITVMVIKA